MRTKHVSAITLAAALVLAISLTLSCSNDSNDDNPVVISSSSQKTDVSSSSDYSSSSNEQNTSSSLGQGSSSSGQADCEALNNYNMAVQMNLNGDPVVVTKNGSALIEGVNYRVSTTQNSIKVSGLNDYIGSVERTNSNTSGIVVKDSSKVLTENTDYAIVETANSVKIVGMGNYIGSVEVELPCEPEPPIIEPSEGLMYWGHTFSNDPAIIAEYFDWHLETDMSGLGAGHKYIESGSITGTVKEIQIHAGTGYRIILIPQSAGVPTRIDDAIGNNVKEGYPMSNITIKGSPYYLFMTVDSITDTGDLLTIIRW
jgi:hypothetical protein